MADQYDVIVIGGGAAGENAAGRAAAGGLRVVLVESDLVGGECSYWACMPSKALLRPGEVLTAARRVPATRQAVTGAIDVPAALRTRDSVTDGWDDSSQVQWLDSAGVELVRGSGALTGERAVRVVDGDGGNRDLLARLAVVIATGSAAAMPPIEGLAEARPWDSRAATSARQVPGRLIVLGGGVVGVEMAQAWRQLGARQVTIVEMEDRLLYNEEPFAGEILAETFKASGIRVVTGARMTAVRRGSAGVTATLAIGETIDGDEILVAVGRKPLTEHLGLEAAGLQPGQYIEVDDQLRARGVKGGWLYAVGDVNGRNLLTHMGKYQARLAADHILGRQVQAVADHAAASRVIFTDPQVAAAGMTERQAREKGLNVCAVIYPYEGVAGGMLAGEGIRGKCQIVVDEDRQVIVGATFVGPGTGELLHAATIAIAGEVPLEKLWHAVPAFPTVSEVWLRLLEAHGM